MTKIAVIGANGFIGRHLVPRLLKIKDIQLQTFGRQSQSDLPNYNKYDVFSDSLSTELSETEFIYYLISETIPATSWNMPVFEIEKNLLPFLKLLGTLKNPHRKKIIFLSSGGTVYGPTNGKVNELAPTRPFSPYGITKLSMENFLEYYRVNNGLNYNVFRISNVYGEGQNTQKGLGIINTFLEHIITDGKLTVYGDGSATRNYIYIDDVCEILAHSINNNDSEIFNLSSNTTLDIRDLIELMRTVISSSFEVIFKQARLSDNSFIDLDNSKLLKYFPEFRFTPIESGIKKTYDYLKMHHGQQN